MAKPNTKSSRHAFEALSNDGLAAVYMWHLNEKLASERMMNIIKTVAQERMESMGMRILPTDGPFRIKGRLIPDLTEVDNAKGPHSERGLLIKSVSFARKEVLPQTNEYDDE